MKKYHVTIDEMAGGSLIVDKVEIGDKLTITLADENGCPIEANGIITSID